MTRSSSGLARCCSPDGAASLDPRGRSNATAERGGSTVAHDGGGGVVRGMVLTVSVFDDGVTGHRPCHRVCAAPTYSLLPKHLRSHSLLLAHQRRR